MYTSEKKDTYDWFCGPGSHFKPYILQTAIRLLENQH